MAVSALRVEEAAALVRMIEQELERGEPSMSEVVEAYLSALLVKCAQWVREGVTSTQPLADRNDPVRRFEDLVERGYLVERSVGHYADKLALSADHLNELVKKRLGRTASAVIHERLLWKRSDYCCTATRASKRSAMGSTSRTPLTSHGGSVRPRA